MLKWLILSLFNMGIMGVLYLMYSCLGLMLVWGLYVDISKYIKRHKSYNRYLRTEAEIMTKINAYETGKIINISELRQKKSKYKPKYNNDKYCS